MRIIIGITMGVFFGGLGFSETTDSTGIQRWKNSAMSRISSISNPATKEEIWSISPYVRVAGRGAKYMEAAHFEVVAAAQEAILRDENHAKKFSEILDESKERWEKNHRDNEFDRTRTEVFKTLSHLPSPQVVELLGSMLNDTEWPIHPFEHGDASVAPSNARLSVFALQELLEDPPATHGKGSMGHLIVAEFPVWQLWYDHVKAGSRTFRFKGDPRPYNFKGVAPVARSSTPLPSKLPTPAEPVEAIPEVAPSRSWLPLALSSLVLLGAGAWLLKSRRAA
jgi:hypothetical protein